MDVLVPEIAKGQSLLFLGEGSGSIVARRGLSVTGKDGVVVGETNTLAYLERVVRPSIVRVDRKTGGVLLAATPSSDTDSCSQVRGVWPFVTATESVCNTVLINCSAIDHVATMLANAGTLGARDGGMLLWGEGATPSVVRVIEAVDGELLEIRRAIGLSESRRYRDFLIDQGLALDAGPDLYGVMRASKLVTSCCPTGPAALKSRYLTEDIPYALVLASSIAIEAAVATPVVDGLIAIGEAMLGRDLRAEGRTLASFGLAGAGVEALREFAESGQFP
jgi:opine dehydrogenase